MVTALFRSRQSRVIVLSIVTLAVALTVATLGITQALDRRTASAEAAELRTAAVVVGAADALAQSDGTFDQDALEGAVATLLDDNDAALSSLNAQDRTAAKALLADIGHCGIELAAGEVDQDGHDHQRLQSLLTQAADAAAAEAGAAETRALAGIGAAIVALLATAWLTMRRRIQRARRRSEQNAEIWAAHRLDALLNDAPDVLLVVADDESIAYRSGASELLLPPGIATLDHFINASATSQRDALRHHIEHPTPDGSIAVFELRTLDGEPRWFEIRVSDLREDDFVGGRVITTRDITNEIQLRDRLRHQALTDALTSLPNRRALDLSLASARAAVATAAQVATVFVIDIDEFKGVNDSLGHGAGDQLLRQVARRLDTARFHDDVLLRLGGDEFALIALRPPGASPEAYGQQLIASLVEPLLVDDRLVRIAASVGYASSAVADDVDQLLHDADIALYEAKRRGGGCVVAFDRHLEADAMRKTRIGIALRQADFDEEFALAFQPVVETATGRTTSLEALLRWNSPSLGAVGPHEFIEIAETSGMIDRIGQWVLSGACAQLREWIDLGIDETTSVSVNVSARQLDDPEFVDNVLATIRHWSVTPERIVLELTESTILDGSGAAISQLEQLRTAGIRIAIDDFGSGYANLGHLLRVPFDILKVDRSLLLMLTDMRECAGGDPTDPCGIMEAIVSIATILGATVVSEGVETDDQLTSLRTSGVGLVQGYLTGRPSPPQEITERLCLQATTAA